MMKRAYNFNAGPAALPEEVLVQAAAEMTDYRGTGMGVMELSHRSAEYDALHEQARADLRELLAIPDDFAVMFVQGGASHQFMMIPANLAMGRPTGYADTGVWAQKAMQETGLYGQPYKICDAAPGGYRDIPAWGAVEADTAYVHITTNNTIYGTQYREIPAVSVPVVADMSSDIASRPIDWTRVAAVYAGTQKNLGPAGMAVVVMHRDLIRTGNARLPKILQYRTYADNRSLYNTPPSYAIYILGLVLDWMKRQGGVAEMERRARVKSQLLYTVIDRYPEVFVGHARPEARSLMNVTFTLRDRAQEAVFVAAAKAQGFVGVKGHRLVGGLRVSLYNAVPQAAVEALAQWMTAYAEAQA